MRGLMRKLFSIKLSFIDPIPLLGPVNLLGPVPFLVPIRRLIINISVSLWMLIVDEKAKFTRLFWTDALSPDITPKS